MKGFKWNHKRAYKTYRELRTEPADQATPSAGVRKAAAAAGGADRDQPVLVDELHTEVEVVAHAIWPLEQVDQLLACHPWKVSAWKGKILRCSPESRLS